MIVAALVGAGIAGANSNKKKKAKKEQERVERERQARLEQERRQREYENNRNAENFLNRVGEFVVEWANRAKNDYDKTQDEIKEKSDNQVKFMATHGSFGERKAAIEEYPKRAVKNKTNEELLLLTQNSNFNWRTAAVEEIEKRKLSYYDRLRLCRSSNPTVKAIALKYFEMYE